MDRTLFTDEHRMFRDAVRRFIEKEIAPHHDQWEKDGIVPRDLWLKAGAQGFLCMDAPEAYGGGGVKDFRYAAIMAEEQARTNCTGPGFALHNDVALPYILNYASEEQQARWIPATVACCCCACPTRRARATSTSSAMATPTGSRGLRSTNSCDGTSGSVARTSTRPDAAPGQGARCQITTERELEGLAAIQRRVERIVHLRMLITGGEAAGPARSGPVLRW